jgi:hypothetical protein
MFDNGLVRFSTRQYRKIKKHSNNRDRFMHLTNYSVNKKSGAFEARTDGDMEAATGRCSHMTCFTGTKVRILTRNADMEAAAALTSYFLIRAATT